MQNELVHTAFEILSHEGERIQTDVRYLPNGSAKPVLIFLHGFKGFKDWGPFPLMMEAIAENGFVALSFNFSHNGIGDDLFEFSELERFRVNTFSRELSEAGAVIEAVTAGRTPVPEGEINPASIGLMGHSRGAAMAILAGSANEHISAIAALSPVSTFERYTERQKERWRREGVFQVQNVRTKQVMPLGIELLEDLESNSERLNILSAARKIGQRKTPLIVAVGSEDLIAPTREAHAIESAAAEAGGNVRLEVIPKTGHTFDGAHPSNGEIPAIMNHVLEIVLSFFGQYLNTGKG